jgi:hypothetical protein
MYSAPKVYRGYKFRVLSKYVYSIQKSSQLNEYLEFLYEAYMKSVESQNSFFSLQMALGSHIRQCDKEDCLCFMLKARPDEVAAQKQVKNYFPIFDTFAEKSKRLSGDDLLLHVFDDVGKIDSMKEHTMNNLKRSDKNVQDFFSNLARENPKEEQDTSDECLFLLDIGSKSQFCSLMCSFYNVLQNNLKGRPPLFRRKNQFALLDGGLPHFRLQLAHQRPHVAVRPLL